MIIHWGPNEVEFFTKYKDTWIHQRIIPPNLWRGIATADSDTYTEISTADSDTWTEVSSSDSDSWTEVDTQA